MYMYVTISNELTSAGSQVESNAHITKHSTVDGHVCLTVSHSVQKFQHHFIVNVSIVDPHLFKI